MNTISGNHPTHRAFAYLGAIALLTLGYLGTAFVASGVGLHQQIMPFWAPAGVALAAVLRFGPSMLPGVFLGNLLFNLLIPLSWEDSISGTNVLSAVLIGSGAAIQAGLGGFLIRRFELHPLTPGSGANLFKYLLFSGLLTCLINATIGTSAVTFINHAGGSAGFLADWFSWWLGDSFGAVVVTPLVLALITRDGERYHYQRRGLMLHLTGMLVVVMLLNALFIDRLHNQLMRDFDSDTRLLEARLTSTIERNFADLFYIGQNFANAGGLSPLQFRDRVMEIQKTNPSVRAYSWDPLVEPGQRAQFEQHTRTLLGNPEFSIRGKSIDPGDPLVPVQMVEPRELNRAALGFNLLSLPDRRRWVLQAQKSGQPMATQILHLQQALNVPGFLILQPVYRLVHDSAGLLNRQRQLVGFMVGVFTVKRLVDSVLAESGIHDIRISLTEKGSSNPFFSTLMDGDYAPPVSGHFSLSVAQQVWQVRTQPGPDYMAARPSSNAIDLQLLLMVSAVVTTLLILSMHDRARSLLMEVNRQTESLAHQALHDALTGLPNRSHLVESITRRIGLNEGVPFALLFIDLDRFKLINDSLGHQVGDRLLQEISSRLMMHLPAGSELFRMGGDEFILLVEGDRQRACNEADRVLIACTVPMQVDEYQLQVTASVGVSLYPAHGQDLDTLTKHADTAMYRAKARGKNRYAVYTEELTDQAVRSFSLEQDLRQAISQKQLLLHYQPQYDLNSLELVGTEALVRWQHPERGLMPPGLFIPLAEETQLIIPLGWQVIEMACEQMSLWDAQGLFMPCVAINISPLQLLQVDFVSRLNALVDSQQVPRNRIELEITELMIMQDPDLAMTQLHKLREAGYRIALDDFGTGYSSLDRLKYLPLDRLKIDQAFTRDIGRNSKDEAIILTVIALGRSLGIEVLAEGVETEEQQVFLQQNNCNSVQGYLLGRPVPAEALILSDA